MAKPRTNVPSSATNRKPDRPDEGEAALRAVIEEYGGEYADAIEYTDELEDAITTAILVLASVDDDEVEHVTASITSLVRAADGLSTEETADLAERTGENATELADALDAVATLQREGHLEDLIELAKIASALDLDEDAVRGLNRLLRVVGAADRTLTALSRLGRQGTNAVSAGIRSVIGRAKAERG